MAVNLSTAIATGSTGFEPDAGGMVREPIVVTGSSSSANDTGSWTSYMKQPQYAVIPCCSYSISGQVVTLMMKWD